MVLGTLLTFIHRERERVTWCTVMLLGERHTHTTYRERERNLVYNYVRETGRDRE